MQAINIRIFDFFMVKSDRRFSFGFKMLKIQRNNNENDSDVQLV